MVLYSLSGQILLLKRADHPDFWQSVTGSMEWSETSPRETACRELAEELGWQDMTGLRDLGWTQEYKILPQWRQRYAPGVQTNREHAFILAIPEPVPVHLNPGEHSEYAWLDFEQAMARATSWSNRNVIERVVRPSSS